MGSIRANFVVTSMPAIRYLTPSSLDPERNLPSNTHKLINKIMRKNGTNFCLTVSSQSQMITCCTETVWHAWDETKTTVPKDCQISKCHLTRSGSGWWQAWIRAIDRRPTEEQIFSFVPFDLLPENLSVWNRRKNLWKDEFNESDGDRVLILCHVHKVKHSEPIWLWRQLSTLIFTEAKEDDEVTCTCPWRQVMSSNLKGPQAGKQLWVILDWIAPFIWG